jgi:hypothetical protein
MDTRVEHRFQELRLLKLVQEPGSVHWRDLMQGT